MRWLHLSDLHFGRTTRKGLRKHRISEEDTWTSLKDHVLKRTREGLGPDYIFITGDISWDGETDCLETAKARIESLCNYAGFHLPKDWGRVFVVPGNHDVWHARGPTGDIDFQPAKGPKLHARFNAKEMDRERLREARQGAARALDPGHRVLPQGLENFAEFLHSIGASGSHFTEVPPGSLTFYSILSNAFGVVGIVGFCTAWACYDSEFDDQEDALPCGARLVQTAVKKVMERDPALIILLGHHPSKYLYDFKSVLEACGPVPTLYLRGHQHLVGALLQQGVVQSLEIGSGALHLDAFKETERPHGLIWGRFDGEKITIEPLVQSREFPSFWTLDTSAWPNRDFQNYCLMGEVKRDGFYLPQGTIPKVAPPDFVGIGLASLGTLGTLDREFRQENDFKTDFVRLWEPELGTFCTIMCRALAHWGRRGKVGLVTSIGDDPNGMALRRLLNEKDIRLLFCRRTSKTGRQYSLTPRNTDTRYNIDDQVRRLDRLSDLEETLLSGVVPAIAQARCVAFDKYELAIARRIFNHRTWLEQKRKPITLFESGSRPLRRTRAGLVTREVPELELLPHIDIFTTTWEWTRDFTGQAGLLHPDSWNPHELDDQMGKYADYLSGHVAPVILPPGEISPRIAVISLSRAGCCLLHRGNGGNGFTTKRLPVLTMAGEISSRQGAGDILRAALVERLLRLGASAEPGSDPFLAVGKANFLEALSVAQYAVYLWLRRDPGVNYFSGFEPDFEEIIHKWREESAELR